jgi:hypothetical protein
MRNVQIAGLFVGARCFLFLSIDFGRGFGRFIAPFEKGY